jgi:beta-lactamase regulating signal transducer with metallopeptidase domain
MPAWTFLIAVPEQPRRPESAGALPPQAARASATVRPRPVATGAGFGDSGSVPGNSQDTHTESLGAMPLGWRAWLFLAWGAVIGVQARVIVRQGARLNRLLRAARPSDDLRLNDIVKELAGRLGLRRLPEIWLTELDGSPFVCGLGRPKLVLPAALLDRLEVESLRAVLLHELAHIKRGDLLWDWIPAIVRVLYFFNPLTHFLFDRIRLERELACDRAAMLLAGQGAAGYAATLIEVVGRASAPPMLRAALGSAGFDGGGRWVPTELTSPTTTSKE